MPKPLSNDLRKRIIDAKLRSDTEEKTALEKEVCKSTVTKLSSLYKNTGSYFPRSGKRGRKPALSEHQMEQLGHAIEERPDIALRELIDELSLPVCVSALCGTVKSRLGFRYKKKRYIPLNSSGKMSA